MHKFIYLTSTLVGLGAGGAGAGLLGPAGGRRSLSKCALSFSLTFLPLLSMAVAVVVAVAVLRHPSVLSISPPSWSLLLQAGPAAPPSSSPVPGPLPATSSSSSLPPPPRPPRRRPPPPPPPSNKPSPSPCDPPSRAGRPLFG